MSLRIQFYFSLVWFLLMFLGQIGLLLGGKAELEQPSPVIGLIIVLVMLHYNWVCYRLWKNRMAENVAHGGK